MSVLREKKRSTRLPSDSPRLTTAPGNTRLGWFESDRVICKGLTTERLFHTFPRSEIDNIDACEIESHALRNCCSRLNEVEP